MQEKKDKKKSYLLGQMDKDIQQYWIFFHAGFLQKNKYYDDQS